MPRWLQIVLTLALFAIIMLAVRAVLVATIPSVLAPIDQAIGEKGTLILILAVCVASLCFGAWPRDAEGRMRPPLSRRGRFSDR